jgi:hypothetical protein
MAYKKYARECTACSKGMNEGYCIEGGMEYYCSDACLHTEITHEEYMELYADGEGDSYWTTWYEDPDEYMVDEDDPAPNKLSVDLLEDGGMVDSEKVRHILDKQLRRAGLDPDKYEFINWTINCDVQIKEEV